ncbi:MAG: hypothetical protein ACI8XB_000865 [Patiriisocius sp.]|jgi:hypothetical protein
MKYAFTLLLLFAIIYGCQNASNIILRNKISEAVIDYDITFPYIEADGLTASFLPNKMTMHLKGNQYSTKIKTYGGIFKSANIVDTKERQFTQMLKIFKKKVTCDYNTTDMRNFIDEFPNFTLIPSTETKEVVGIMCKKATGVFHDISTPDITIYYTNKFKIKDPNWCNPFSEIDGVMLAYEIEQFDTRARITAANVTVESVNDEEIIKEPGYIEVEYAAMKIEFEKIMDSFSI